MAYILLYPVVMKAHTNKGIKTMKKIIASLNDNCVIDFIAHLALGLGGLYFIMKMVYSVGSIN